jgi:hypothetical protein
VSRERLNDEATAAAEDSEPLQLTLDDDLDEGLSFGEWMESLPTDLEAA